MKFAMHKTHVWMVLWLPFFFSPFLLCSYFYIFFHFIGTEKKNAFFVCYMCPHTHESRTAHFSSDGLRVFCQTIRVQLNMKMLQSFLLLSKTPNSSWMVFFPFMSVSFSLELTIFHPFSWIFPLFLSVSQFSMVNKTCRLATGSYYLLVLFHIHLVDCSCWQTKR